MMRSPYGPVRRDRDEYAMACGRMRALEKRLLGGDRLEELSAARDVPSALGLLRRWGWASPASRGGDDWEGIVDAALAESDRELLATDPRPTVTALLVMKFEVLNLCALFKARALGISRPPPRHPRGLSGPADLEKTAGRMDFSSYPAPLAARLEPLREIPAGDGGGWKVAAIVAAAHHGALLEAAGREGSPLMVDFLGHLADIENIKLRLRALRHPPVWSAGDFHLSGGNLDVGEILAAADEGALVSRMGGTVYAPLMAAASDGAGRVSEGALQRCGDDFLTALLGPARYVSLGPEPLWAYHHAREIDGKNVRTCVLGILAGSDPREVQGRLRRPYA